MGFGFGMEFGDGSGEGEVSLTCSELLALDAATMHSRTTNLIPRSA